MQRLGRDASQARGSAARDDHCHRWTGGVRQGHARQAHRRALRPGPPRYWPALPRRRARRCRRGGALDDESGRRAGRRSARSRHARRPGPARRRGPARPPRSLPASRRCGPRCWSSSATSPATPPGAVLDGRDIGTVVCPDADVKIYVTASPEVRARAAPSWSCRQRGEAVTYEAVLADIRRRDERDAERAEAPPCAPPPTPSCWIPAIWI